MFQFIKAVMLVGVMISGIQAEIPFSMLFHVEEFLDDTNKDAHPLIGWAALHTNLIRNLRFHGNFTRANAS